LGVEACRVAEAESKMLYRVAEKGVYVPAR